MKVTPTTSATPTGQADGAHALRLRGVCKTYGKTAVIRHLDLSVARGSALAIIGPNGAGKSTVFDLISGRSAPDAGEIWLDDQRIDGRPAHTINRLGLSRSFQVSQLFTRLSVIDNLRCAVLWRMGYRYTFWRALSALRDVNQRATQVMEQIALASQRDTLAQALTYGEQRALEFGLTIAGGADVILLDEPTAGMGRGETQRFVELIRDLTRGKTVLTVEHDMDVVFELADTVAVLVHGELIALDTPQAVRGDPRVQQAYLGTAATSPLAGEHGAC